MMNLINLWIPNMGGRSDDRFRFSETWAWVGELNNERLINYGKYSAIEINKYKDAHGIAGNNGPDGPQGALNYEISKEYYRRFGFMPDFQVGFTEDAFIRNASKRY